MASTDFLTRGIGGKVHRSVRFALSVVYFMKPRVLVIEDNEQNRYLAAFLLERAGAELSFACNGAEGVRIAKESRPDIIVMDVQMPEMDGYTAARILTSEPETAGIPMIAVTSYAMAGDRARAITTGFSDYLEKPFDPENFAARVLALAGRGDAHQGPSPAQPRSP